MARSTNRKKQGGPAPNRAVRKMLRNFEANNRAERRYVPPEMIERQIRAQVQHDHPDLAPADIEKRVARRMSHGMKPHLGNHQRDGR